MRSEGTRERGAARCGRDGRSSAHFILHEKMIGFYKPKTYRSSRGCCICKAKSSSSRFTDSKRYQDDFQDCFGLHESRTGDICNACVLLVKRWKKLPSGSKKNWNHVVDARGGPNLRALRLRPKRIRTLAAQRRRMKSKLLNPFSGAHSTASSTSPTHSSSCSNHSDTDTDTEVTPTTTSRSSSFSFLDPVYWKRERVCCGVIYKGRYGEILIDAQQFKPCCSNKKTEEATPR